MGKQVERWYPFAVGLVGPSLTISLWRAGFSPATDQVASALNGAIGMGAIVVGFLATTLAVLAAVPDRPVMRFMRRRGGLELIIDYLEHAILLWLFTTVGGLLILFFLPSLRGNGFLPVGCVWTYLFAVSLVAFHRAAWLVGETLRLVLRSLPNSD